MVKNTNLTEDITLPSQLDMGGVIRDVHDFPGHSLRIRDAVSAVKVNYDTFDVTYNIDDKPTQVLYYSGIKQHSTSIGFIADTAGSLNNKYFNIYTGRNGIKLAVWYNVGGLGTPPVLSNTTLLEIPLSTNDGSQMVALATEMLLNAYYARYFTIVRKASVLEILHKDAGVTTNTTDFNSGFTFLNTPGENELVQKVDITYNGNNPVYQGEELIGYIYDIYTGKFIVSQAANIGSISVNADLDGFDLTNPDSVMVTGSIDGESTGQKFGFVYNVRQQILSSHDRDQDIVYADFGTKTQRVTQIDYTSATFPGVIARKVFTYTLVGNRYRRDKITWVII